MFTLMSTLLVRGIIDYMAWQRRPRVLDAVFHLYDFEFSGLLKLYFLVILLPSCMSKTIPTSHHGVVSGPIHYFLL